jgi:hypothetical protein
MQYDLIEPFGEWRADYRSAEIVTMIANVNRDPKKKRDPYKTTDFLVKFGERTADDLKPKQTWQEQKAILKLLAHAITSKEPERKKRK